MSEVRTVMEQIVTVPYGDNGGCFYALVRNGYVLEACIKIAFTYTGREIGYIRDSIGMFNKIKAYPEEFKEFLLLIKKAEIDTKEHST